MEERDCERDHGERESNERKQVSAPPCLSGLAAQWLAGCIYQSTWHFPSRETVSRDLDRCAPPMRMEAKRPSPQSQHSGTDGGREIRGGRTEERFESLEPHQPHVLCAYSIAEQHLEGLV